MKKIHLLALVAISAFISSCGDNSASPDVDDRDKFTGSWICKETVSGSAATTFTIDISKKGNADTILIKNFSGYGSSAIATAYVVGTAMTIPAQNIGVTNIPVQGSGVYSKTANVEKLKLDYKTDGNTATADCNR